MRFVGRRDTAPLERGRNMLIRAAKRERVGCTGGTLAIEERGGVERHVLAAADLIESNKELR